MTTSTLMVRRMRAVHATFGEHGDVVTANLIESCINETEMRVWFLFEPCQDGNNDNHS